MKPIGENRREPKRSEGNGDNKWCGDMRWYTRTIKNPKRSAEKLIENMKEPRRSEGKEDNKWCGAMR